MTPFSAPYSRDVTWEDAALVLEPHIRRYKLGGLLESGTLRRLRGIGFMGALGPGPHKSIIDNRYDHTCGVALSLLLIAQSCDFESRTVRYALAACLLHDSANRALSHTCEGVFDRIGRTSGKQLTRAIVLGRPRNVVPSVYIVSDLLRQHGLDPDVLYSVLSRRPDPGAGGDVGQLVEILRSPFNPDTLDGIYRAAAIGGFYCPSPDQLASLLINRAGKVGIRAKDLHAFDSFWEAKGNVYESYIHARSSIMHEALYSRLAFALFRHYSPRQLFKLTDKDVRPQIEAAISEGSGTSEAPQLELIEAFSFMRFREPRRYVIVEDSSIELEDDFIPVRALKARYQVRSSKR